jgi:hypothetical protein
LGSCTEITFSATLVDCCLVIIGFAEYGVQDLNVNLKLPFEDNTFDVITNVVCCSYVVFGLKDGPSFVAIPQITNCTFGSFI